MFKKGPNHQHRDTGIKYWIDTRIVWIRPNLINQQNLLQMILMNLDRCDNDLSGWCFYYVRIQVIVFSDHQDMLNSVEKKIDRRLNHSISSSCSTSPLKASHCVPYCTTQSRSAQGGSNSLGIPRGRGWGWDEATMELLHRNHSILSSWTAPSLTMQCFKLLIAPTMILYSTAAQTLWAEHCELKRCSLYISHVHMYTVHCTC